MSHQDAHALGMTWAGDTGFARLPRDTDGRTPDLAILGVPVDRGRAGARRAGARACGRSGARARRLMPFIPF